MITDAVHEQILEDVSLHRFCCVYANTCSDNENSRRCIVESMLKLKEKVLMSVKHQSIQRKLEEAKEKRRVKSSKLRQSQDHSMVDFSSSKMSQMRSSQVRDLQDDQDEISPIKQNVLQANVSLDRLHHSRLLPQNNDPLRRGEIGEADYEQLDKLVSRRIEELRRKCRDIEVKVAHEEKMKEQREVIRGGRRSPARNEQEVQERREWNSKVRKDNMQCTSGLMNKLFKEKYYEQATLGEIQAVAEDAKTALASKLAHLRVQNSELASHSKDGAILAHMQTLAAQIAERNEFLKKELKLAVSKQSAAANQIPHPPVMHNPPHHHVKSTASASHQSSHIVHHLKPDHLQQLHLQKQHQEQAVQVQAKGNRHIGICLHM